MLNKGIGLWEMGLLPIRAHHRLAPMLLQSDGQLIMYI
jgi:hypothetical protein